MNLNVKRLLTAVLVIGVCFSLAPVGFADTGTSIPRNIDPKTGYELTNSNFVVKFNGEIVTFPDAQPIVDENNRTLVPVRFVAEKMGAKVDWDKANNGAVIVKDGKTLRIPFFKDTYTVGENGKTSTVKMDTAAIVKNDRTYVPVRYVATSLGAWVGYSGKYHTAQIYMDELTPEEITRLHSYYDMTYDEWLVAQGKPMQKDDPIRIKYGTVEKNHPMATYNDGTSDGFSDANEAVLRNPAEIRTANCGSWYKTKTYTGMTSKKTYTFNTQPDTDFADMILDEAKSAADEISSKGYVKMSLRTDRSCIYWSRHDGDVNHYVRGVATVTIPENADINYIRQNYDFIINPVAGTTKDYDVLIDVNYFNPSNVHWSEMTALK